MITDARNTFKALSLALPPSLSSNSTRYQLYMYIYIKASICLSRFHYAPH